MLRFTIRDVLWLMALAGALAAWYADHRQASDAYKRTVTERDTAYDKGDLLISTMRLDGYVIEAPNGSRARHIRIMSKPKPKLN